MAATSRDGGPVRVALVAPSLKLGGLERVVRDLALGLKADGCTVGVFLTRSGGVYAEGLEDAGVPVLHLDGPRPRMAHVPVRLARRLARFRPAIIHGHSGTWLPCAVAKMLLRGPALVFTDHGRYLPEPAHRGWIERRFYYRCTDRLVAVSSELSDYLERFLKLSRGPEVIPNGIDLRKYGVRDAARRARLRSEWGVRDDEVLAIAVGRLEPVKDHAGLLAAVARAASDAPGVRLAIAGSGGLEADLRARARQPGLDGRVRFLGHRRDIPDCLAAADLFVSSSASEGLPISLLEAMATGLPIVATAVGGVPEALGTPPAGQLVPPGDPSALAAAIVALAADPGRRRALGAAARERARPFSLEACVQSYRDLYESVRPDGRPARSAGAVRV